MGVTITYSGRLHSPKLIPDICRELRSLSQMMNWKYELFGQDPESYPVSGPQHDSIDENDVGATPSLSGILITLHSKCEPLLMFFDTNGILRNPLALEPENDENTLCWTKTQFAPVEIHMAIVKLLKYLQLKYFQSLEVIDEGRYWETGDKELLVEQMRLISEKMEEVSDALSQSSVDVDLLNSDSDIADKVESILKERFFKGPYTLH